MNTTDLIPTSRDLGAIGRWFFWSAALSVSMRSLGKAFGPLVLAYCPKLYKPLALFGTGVLTMISDAQAFVEMWRPKGEEPPKQPVPPLLLLVMLLALASCKSPFPIDGCLPHEQRCANNQAQTCSGSRRWTPSGPACAEGETCCWTQSVFDNHLVTACVSPQFCDHDGGR